jgi:hypothetical protein
LRAQLHIQALRAAGEKSDFQRGQLPRTPQLQLHASWQAARRKEKFLVSVNLCVIHARVCEFLSCGQVQQWQHQGPTFSLIANEQ